MHKIKPWLRFIEGVEGGSATDETPNAEVETEVKDGEQEPVSWDSLFEGEDPKEVRRLLDNSRKWERRAKDNKAAADELATLKAEAPPVVEDTVEGPSDAELAATRYKVALENGLSREHADLFLTAKDEDGMTAQAEQLAELGAAKKLKRTTGVDASRDRTPPAPTLKSGAELYDRVKAKNLY